MSDYKREVGPVFFNACAPPPATGVFKFIDRFSENNPSLSEAQREQVLSILPSKSTITLRPDEVHHIRASSRIFTVISTDPDCALEIGGVRKHIGAGTFTFFKFLAPYNDFKVLQHTGPLEILHYEMEDNIISAMCAIERVHFYLPGDTPGSQELWVYSNGFAFKYCDVPRTSVLQGKSTRVYQETENVAGFIYSHNIEILQKHPKLLEMKDTWKLSWDRDFVRQSSPPCIVVSVHEDSAEAFFEFARGLLPDIRISGFNDHVTVEITPNVEETARHCAESLTSLEKGFAELLESGLITVEPGVVG